MEGTLWNIGMKVADVDQEVAFFTTLGAVTLIRERVTTDGGELDYALIAFGGTRILMTPKPIFEDKLPEPLGPGLTHAVFEVENLGHEVERLTALGTEVLIPPTEISAAFGRRKLAFFRSPGGLVFEVMQVLSSNVG
jgi:catechol 2,3-dioxygenase-like lactoylglutathione lyase family enzyme